MNTKKISVLEKAIQMLENGFEYNWYNALSCNCGVVVSSLGINSISQVAHALPFGSWSSDNSQWLGICPVTGLRNGVVQTVLFENGFTSKEIRELELLGNKQICDLIGEKVTYSLAIGIGCIFPPDHYKDKNILLKYLRAWVQILREQDSKEQPKVEKTKVEVRYVTVKVDQSIFEQSKELIKN